MAFCMVTVWSPPEGDRFDFFSGYDIRYYIEGSDNEVIASKESSDFFHPTTADIIALGPQDQILVQVSAPTILYRLI